MLSMVAINEFSRDNIETIKSDLMSLKKNPETNITKLGGNDLVSCKPILEKYLLIIRPFCAETKP